MNDTTRATVDWKSRYAELEEQMASTLARIADEWEQDQIRTAARSGQRHASVVKREGSLFVVAHAHSPNEEYAFYVYAEDGSSHKHPYSPINSIEVHSDARRVRVFWRAETRPGSESRPQEVVVRL